MTRQSLASIEQLGHSFDNASAGIAGCADNEDSKSYSSRVGTEIEIEKVIDKETVV